ncbi:hypothetical protein [Planococcus donghaensis]|uniref:hypothetical protein n=1 Tax=Planococcus donghaensis TaxID=414778 RepID=UPI003735332A
MWAFWLEGALCLIGLIAILIQWKKERAEEDELVFRIKAAAYFTLYFYTTLCCVFLISATFGVFHTPVAFTDFFSPGTTWVVLVDLFTWGVLYPALLFLYFSVETVFRFWKRASIILSGKATKDVYREMIPDGVWLLFASLCYAIIVIVYQMEGFLWISTFLLLVMLKELVLNRNKRKRPSL